MNPVGVTKEEGCPQHDDGHPFIVRQPIVIVLKYSAQRQCMGKQTIIIEHELHEYKIAQVRAEKASFFCRAIAMSQKCTIAQVRAEKASFFCRAIAMSQRCNELIC